MTELLPCPFCGGEGHISKSKKGSMYYHHIECLNCAAMTEISETPILKKSNQSELEAIVKWNKRHQPIEPLYYPSEQIIGETNIAKQLCDVSLKYKKALEALKEVAANFENIDSGWVKRLIEEELI